MIHNVWQWILAFTLSHIWLENSKVVTFKSSTHIWERYIVYLWTFYICYFIWTLHEIIFFSTLKWNNSNKIRWMLFYVRVSDFFYKMIKWYNKHLILIILPHLVIGRNRTHNFKSSCLYMSYFPLMLRKKFFSCKEKQNWFFRKCMVFERLNLR
jgi:hypothetical protein